MENFYTAIPYADIMISEKNFTALAKQEKLNEKYGVALHSKLEEIFKNW
jgi:hypothetical protein